MKFVVIVLSDFLGGCTPELMMDLDETPDSWINHHYTHGSSGLVTTCREVKCVCKVFGHNFQIWIG